MMTFIAVLATIAALAVALSIGGGRTEKAGPAGRNQVFDVDTLSNIELQDPAYFVAPATGVIVGQPFALFGAWAAGALAANTMYTVPTGFKIRVLDSFVELQGAGVANCVVTLMHNTTAITNTFAASGSDKAIVRMTTIDDAQKDLVAAEVLKSQSTLGDGSNQPAYAHTVLAMRLAV
jgi:hypothetical protein